ncbi:hypothetical protein [Myxococcus sp. RHSTA-1-4]|uniref:hypothetical protein n=1 Tax=Myxococcus sp. RHSTA-1-4 TaxID=2874601 RepID=UPI001CBDB7E3|nr:hypothetical protein [Myxococcus sp. RHSTA-1-4]MBZ4416711.1 hypothetical protein [Myxococcus sp. RHSTA-1-4]
MLGLCRLLLDTEPEPEARNAYHLSLCFMSGMALYLGCLREADACFERLERTGREVVARDDMVRGWRNIEYSFRSLYSHGEPWQALAWAEQCVGTFGAVGSERGDVVVLSWMAQALLALGDVRGAVERARQGVALALRVSPRFGVTFAQQNLATVLVASPESAHRQEARELVLEWMERRIGNRLDLGVAHRVLAQAAAASGEQGEAEARARQACEFLAPFIPFLSEAHSKLGATLLSQGRAAEAREEVERALRELEAMGGEGRVRVELLQVLAESCFAQGDVAAGEQALHDALRSLRARASIIPEPAVRQRFLHQVPENARTLELARQRDIVFGI